MPRHVSGWTGETESTLEQPLCPVDAFGVLRSWIPLTCLRLVGRAGGFPGAHAEMHAGIEALMCAPPSVPMALVSDIDDFVKATIRGPSQSVSVDTLESACEA